MKQFVKHEVYNKSLKNYYCELGNTGLKRALLATLVLKIVEKVVYSWVCQRHCH